MNAEVKRVIRGESNSRKIKIFKQINDLMHEYEGHCVIFSVKDMGVNVLNAIKKKTYQTLQFLFVPNKLGFLALKRYLKCDNFGADVNGHIMLVFSKDIFCAASVAKVFSKQIKNHLFISVLIWGNKIEKNQDMLEAISAITSVKHLNQSLISSIYAPVLRFQKLLQISCNNV